MPPDSSVAPIPEGAVLLHIGPHKTGSSAVQHALAAARPRLAEYGAAYPPAEPDPRWPGFQHRAARPGWAVMGHTPRGLERPDMAVWDAFAAEVREASAAGLRVCVSSETFCAADSTAVARKIATDLGGDRVHLLIACRPLHRVLPSTWQQRAQEGRGRGSYAAYLKRHLLVPPERRRRTNFWRYQGMAHPLQTWIPAVPPERSTVVVMPDGDRDILPRTTELLLGLPTGLLAAPKGANANASLPYERAELLRRLNGVATEREWPRRDYIKVMRRVVLSAMEQVPVQAEEKHVPGLPQWARELMPRLEQERIDAIHESGARVVGDLERLLDPLPAVDTTEVGRAASLPMEVAAHTVAQLCGRLLEAQGEAAQSRAALREALRQRDGAAALGGISSREMLREVWRRQLRRVGRS